MALGLDSGALMIGTNVVESSPVIVADSYEGMDDFKMDALRLSVQNTKWLDLLRQTLDSVT